MRYKIHMADTMNAAVFWNVMLFSLLENCQMPLSSALKVVAPGCYETSSILYHTAWPLTHKTAIFKNNYSKK
jgi:N-acetyl-gamma-glutamylphosphate reductase